MKFVSCSFSQPIKWRVMYRQLCARVRCTVAKRLSPACKQFTHWSAIDQYDVCPSYISYVWRAQVPWDRGSPRSGRRRSGRFLGEVTAQLKCGGWPDTRQKNRLDKGWAVRQKAGVLLMLLARGGIMALTREVVLKISSGKTSRKLGSEDKTV